MLSCASIYCCLVVTAGKGLTSWLSFVMSNCGFVTFPFVIGILGQVWYLIVLIPVLCPLSLNIILLMKQKTKALIRLHRCAGWSAPLLFAKSGQVFSHRSPFIIHVPVNNAALLLISDQELL